MAGKIKSITVNELWKMCVEQRKNGNGNKKILISADDEGNDFHHLFHGFTPAKDPHERLDLFDA